MVTDGSSFLRRAQTLFRELQAGRFPNSNTLSQLCRCSKNTAQRTIYRLRDEYLVPLDYNSAERGYYLTDPNYTLPTLLPAGRDELTALLFARDIVRNLAAPELIASLDSLWNKFANANTAVSRELGPLVSYFSCDSTVISDMADRGILQYVSAAKAGESVSIKYKSPWRHTEEKTYSGKIQRVHLSDGALYLLFSDTEGHERILNCSFIRDFKVLDYTLQIPASKSDDLLISSENWLEGFGIWAGDELAKFEIHILPPAAEYYASQRWHGDQVDTWDGEILIRQIPGIVSPEIERRILSLGKYVAKVSPESLKAKVVEQASTLLNTLNGPSAAARSDALQSPAAQPSAPRKHRKGRVYEPGAEAPFKLSRSKIENFIKCPRCFYLDRRLGISQPSGPPFTLNTAVDSLLKAEFDTCRASLVAHELMTEHNIDAIPFQHADLDKWRHNFTGVQHHHATTNFLITGAVDDIWVRPNGELIVVDYKATAKDGEINIDAEWQNSYKRQMEIYQWLLRRNGFQVSDTGYFVYCNGKKDRGEFKCKLEFEVHLIGYVGSDGWVEGVLGEVFGCLNSEVMPEGNAECEFCEYRRTAKVAEG